MENIKKLIRQIIVENYPSRLAMHITPIDYRSPGGRGPGVPAASKLTGDTPQRAQLGRPPRPTPMHGQTGGTSVSGTDYMGSKMIQNSGDSYYNYQDYEDPGPVPNLGDEDVRVREKIRKLVHALLLDPEDVDIEKLSTDHEESSVSHLPSHIPTRSTTGGLYEGETGDESDELDEDDTDEASGAAAAGGGPAMPLGAGPNYPNKSRRRTEPPPWYYYMHSLPPGTKVVE